jgi:hypothetical protein
MYLPCWEPTWAVYCIIIFYRQVCIDGMVLLTYSRKSSNFIPDFFQELNELVQAEIVVRVRVVFLEEFFDLRFEKSK